MTYETSKAIKLYSAKGPDGAAKYLDDKLAAALAFEPEMECEYGHCDCALYAGGPCSDELAGLVDTYIAVRKLPTKIKKGPA